MKETFGEFIRKQRKEKKLPIRKVASELDLDQSSLSKYERCKRLPPREYVEKFAKFYLTDYNDLLISYLSDMIVFSIKEEINSEQVLEAAHAKLKHLNRKDYTQENLNFQNGF